MDIFENRRQRLRWLIEHECGGKISECARRIGRHQSYVSRLLYPAGKKGKRNIANGLISAIEAAFSLPHGWLDFSPERDETLAEVAALFRDLPATKKGLALEILRVMARPAATSQPEDGEDPAEDGVTPTRPSTHCAGSPTGGRARPVYPLPDFMAAERRIRDMQVETERRRQQQNEEAHA